MFGAEGDDAIDTLRLKKVKQAELPAAATTNDAAEDLMRPEPPPEPETLIEREPGAGVAPGRQARA